MDKEKLLSCVSSCRDAYIELNQAKEDCNDTVDATIELLSNTESVGKEDIKAIKKIAKAYAKGNIKPLTNEAETMAEMFGIIFPAEEEF